MLALALVLAAASDKPIALKAARMFDGRAMSAPGLVVVKGNRIVAVGAKAAVPPDAQVIDLGDSTLMPGLIDAHVHLDGESTSDWKQDYLDGLHRSIGENALRAIPHARVTLLAGFTTVRNVGASDLNDIALRNAIRDGIILGPRIVAATQPLGTTGGHCDYDAMRPGLLAQPTAPGIADGPDALRLKVREAIKNGADVIKVCASGGVLSLGDDVDVPQLTQSELDAIVDEAHARKRKVAVHAHGALAAKRSIKAGCDSIEHGTFLDDEAIDLMKQKGTFFIPTRAVIDDVAQKLKAGQLPPPVVPKATLAIAAGANALRKAIAKGVRIGLGTDSGVQQHGHNARELGLLVEAGMKPIDALKAGTTVDAELLGLSADLGSLEAGKLADVIAVPGDPSKDVTVTEHVRFVMKDGAVIQ